MAIHDVEALKRAYLDFRRNAMANFIVDVRRTRAQQIRAMTSDPEALPDIETYEREIWRLESRTYLRSRRLELHMFFKYYEQTQLHKAMGEHHLTLDDLHEALRTGDLELQGNYNYGQTSAIFAPMLKEQHTRFNLVKQALHHLNNKALSPQQKVEQVLNTKGFGENNATGLGMIFHPEAIGIVNSATREHLQQIGHTAASKQTWRQLQDVLLSLHKLLKTRDFIELDWFIYLYGTQLTQQNGSGTALKQQQFSNLIPKREASATMVLDNTRNREVPMAVEIFKNDEKRYLAWVHANPYGFVLSTDRGMKPSYMILHQAFCKSIREYSKTAQPGGFTERQYIKVCSTDLPSLKDWVRQHGRPDGSFSRDHDCYW